jgi:EmrB/QacA subfamily drug resistance transporter
VGAPTLAEATHPATGRPDRYVVLGISCASVIVVVMDIAIVNVALPTIRRDLHASEAGLQWTVDAYTLVLASFLMLGGSMADRVGRRRVFQIGLATFGLGSLLCGVASSIGFLVAARVVQAAGGAMLNPVAAAIVATAFPDRAERARAIGLFSAMTGLSMVLGPIVGGILVDRAGWHSIFWVNLPIVAVAAACAGWFVPESRAARARRFDPVGQALIVVALASLVYAIIESRRLGWASPVILGLLAVAVLAGLGLVAYEPHRADPLIELKLLRSLPFSGAILISLCAMCGFGAFQFVNTQYLQDARGLSPQAAGLCLVPLGVVVMAVSALTGRLVATRGARLPLAISGTALALGGLALLCVEASTPLRAVIASYGLIGVFMGTVIAPVTTTAVSGMPGSMAALATSLPSVARQIGATLGVAISGTIVGPALAVGRAAHTVSWLMFALGAVIVVLALVSTGRWARSRALRAFQHF